MLDKNCEFIEDDKISEIKNSEKENDILGISKEIINLLFQCLLKEFRSHLSNFENQNKTYKSNESGNVAEIYYLAILVKV